MFKYLLFLFIILIFLNDLLGNDPIIETNEGKHLLKLKEDKGTELDYNDPTPQQVTTTRLVSQNPRSCNNLT